jgi:hypothetical protein
VRGTTVMGPASENLHKRRLEFYVGFQAGPDMGERGWTAASATTC